MTKRQMIDKIMELNPTAEPEFLAQFDDPDLREYLGKLQKAMGAATRSAPKPAPKGDPADRDERPVASGKMPIRFAAAGDDQPADQPDDPENRRRHSDDVEPGQLSLLDDLAGRER
jgi:hypothetical protein